VKQATKTKEIQFTTSAGPGLSLPVTLRGAVGTGIGVPSIIGSVGV
jgi:hypothetical protein